MTHSFSLLFETLKSGFRDKLDVTSAPPPPAKVDIVYLWKDDSDPHWHAKKRAFIASQQGTPLHKHLAPSDVAIQPQLDELKFSLRSVEQHFRALGNVHLVTDGQRPSWLNVNHPKLNLIDVADLVDEQYFPNYNSQAIESYLYTLDDLSEHFVYFNDDFFLLRDLTSDAFFPAVGKVKVRLGRALSSRGKRKPSESPDKASHKNANRLLDERCRLDYRPTVMHRPYALTKKLYQDLFEHFPDAFLSTRSSQLRSRNTVAIHSMLLPYWAYYTGRAELVAPPLLDKDMYYLGEDEEKNKGIFKRIRASRDIGFCVQGTRKTLSEQMVTHFKAEMTKLYPNASSFEK